MGIFSRKKKTKWAIELDEPSVVPGHALRGSVVATRVAPDERIAVAWAKVTANGRKEADAYRNSYSDSPTVSDEQCEIKLVDVEVLHDIDIAPDGDEPVRIPFEVKVPIWMAPTRVGDQRMLPNFDGPFLELTPRYGKASFEVDGLPVHSVLLDGIGALGCKVKRGRLWNHYRKKGKRNFDHRIECSAPAELEHDDAKVTGVIIEQFAVSPVLAKTSVALMARKFPKGLFELVRVEAVELRDDPQGWADAVKHGLAEKLWETKVEKEAFVDENVISGIIDAWLS